MEMNSLQTWPEPVVPVQSLADTNITIIPASYVKPPSERPSSTSGSFELKPTPVNIPVISLGALVDGTAGYQAVVEALSSACREWGFFQVVNHGVSLDLVEKMKKVWRDYFTLVPVEEKKKLANNPATYEGYGSRTGVEKGASLDWGDYFFLHFLPDSIKDHHKWPPHPASCREITEEYGREMAKLCGELTKLLSISLGLDAAYVEKAFGGEDNVGATLRVNYYPKCPQPDLTLGLSPHSDPGGLTVLLADDRVKGLQVQKGDSWITVEPVPGAFVVNVGDQIQVISNGAFKSVEHRVMVNSEEERFSMAFFYNPNGDVPIEPAQQLVTLDKPALYPRMAFNEYRLYIRKKGPKGKSQLESSLKAI